MDRGNPCAWSGVEFPAVGAFRCDDGGAGLVCLAVSDPVNVVILSELMEGWDSATAALAEQLPGVPHAAVWRARVAEPPASANWTVLFKAQ